MPETIMPGFERFKPEGSIIGRLLTGYGELEFEMCRCIEAVTTDLDAAIRSLFQIWNAQDRITKTANLVSSQYVNAGLGAMFATAVADIDWCRLIRNQYAHCNWYDTKSEGIMFYNLEELSRQPDKIIFVTSQRHGLPLDLLQHQEEFFKNVQKCFWHLYSEYCAWAGRPTTPHWPLPAVVARPRKHN